MAFADEVKTYRKKPVEVEAMQLCAVPQFLDAVEWVRENGGIAHYESHSHSMLVHTLEGEMRASYLDFLIRGVKGEFYPCKPDIFNATYDEVPNND